jgi:ABC-type phosphate transport system ATPase subunit
MFLLEGEIVELDTSEVVFSGDAKSGKTRDYVNGVFG